jgi:tripartite ATP-independent transporter DctM subunit
MAWAAAFPDALPSSGALMLLALVVTLFGGLPVGFVLVLAALVYVVTEGSLPGVIVAQQMARGIDSFVMLAIPFFILVGYLMEANGMSIRLIEMLRRSIGGLRGGFNMVMVLSMVLFSGISGSKMADVAAVGSVLVPAAKRSRQSPGNAVALLAASAVMAETIPPCINLIILGFVANLSIGGLFMAGFLPAAMMASVLIVASIVFGTKAAIGGEVATFTGKRGVAAGAIVSFGLIAMIFIGFKGGYATATEISAFAAIYAVLAGVVVFRELPMRVMAHCLVVAASRSGLVLFICAAAQSLAFTLTIQQIPHALGLFMIHLSQTAGVGTFLLVSIAILIVMGSVLEGAAALILFGPLLVPVAAQIGINPLQFGIVLVVSMGIGLFAPPIGLGLLGACLIGNVALEETIKPLFCYLGLLLICVVIIAFVPAIATTLPLAFGY